MRERITGMITPQMKNIAVNDKFGNVGLKKQQGSTVIRYDSLELTGQTQLRFFEESNNRNFPLTNTGSDGNKLGVGNSMVVERIYLTVGTFNPTTNAWTDFNETNINTPIQLLAAEFGFSIANSEVIKNVPVLSWISAFNKSAENQLNSNYEFDTQIVIPPLLEFVATLRLQNYTAPTERTWVRLTIEGSGAIIAPKTTF
jgi:hypothetical protein